MGMGPSVESMQKRLNWANEKNMNKVKIYNKAFSNQDLQVHSGFLTIEVMAQGIITINGKDQGKIYAALEQFILAEYPPMEVSTVTNKKFVFKQVQPMGCFSKWTVIEGVNVRDEWECYADKMFHSGSPWETMYMINHYPYPAPFKRGVGISAEVGLDNFQMECLKLVDFMMGNAWGLTHYDETVYGHRGQFRVKHMRFKKTDSWDPKAQINFKTNRIKLDKPICYVKIRQNGSVSLEGGWGTEIQDKLKFWVDAYWKMKQVPTELIDGLETIRLEGTATTGFDAERLDSRVPLRACELIDYMIAKQGWTLKAYNMADWGLTGEQRECHLMFQKLRLEDRTHGDRAFMMRMQNTGYIDFYNMGDKQTIMNDIEVILFKFGGYDVELDQQKNWVDRRYKMPSTYFWNTGGLSTNMGRRLVEMARIVGKKGFKLFKTHQTVVMKLHTPDSFEKPRDTTPDLVREQWLLFVEARPGVDNPVAPMVFMNFRTAPKHDSVFQYDELFEISGPDPGDLHRKVVNWCETALQGQVQGPNEYCDTQILCDALSLNHHTITMKDRNIDGLWCGENNYQKIITRFMDFMEDRLHHWECVSSYHNVVPWSVTYVLDTNKAGFVQDQQLIYNKDVILNMKELQMVFQLKTKPREKKLPGVIGLGLGRTCFKCPMYWTPTQKKGTFYQNLIAVQEDEALLMQQILTNTFKKKATAERRGPIPERLHLVQAYRSEHPALFDLYAQNGLEVEQNCIENTSKLMRPLVMDQVHGLHSRNIQADNEINEQYLLMGTGIRNAMPILNKGFIVDLLEGIGGSLFGPGGYLQECSSRADEQSEDLRTDPAFQCVYCMIVVRAAVGRCLITTSPKNCQDVHEKKFNSVCGDLEARQGWYREYVFFDDKQLYPEYLVFYTREYKNEQRNLPKVKPIKPPKRVQQPPECLFVSCWNGPERICGLYSLVPNKVINGKPVWRMLDDEWYVYSDNNAHWTIGGEAALSRKFDCCIGVFTTQIPHGGAFPQYFGGLWLAQDPETKESVLDTTGCVQNFYGDAPQFKVAPKEDPEAEARTQRESMDEKKKKAKERRAKKEKERKKEKEEKKENPSLDIEFADVAGFSQVVTFWTKPLGITFNNRSPLLCKSFPEGSLAQELGVQKGWKFVKVGSVELFGKDWEECAKIIQEASKALEAKKD